VRGQGTRSKPCGARSSSPTLTTGLRYAMSSKSPSRKPVFLPPNQGRRYSMGPIEALFLADDEETAARYSISQWWLEPHTAGPGAHSHDEDDVFFVIEGTMSFLVGDEWIDAPQG